MKARDLAIACVNKQEELIVGMVAPPIFDSFFNDMD